MPAMGPAAAGWTKSFREKVKKERGREKKKAGERKKWKGEERETEETGRVTGGHAAGRLAGGHGMVLTSTPHTYPAL